MVEYFQFPLINSLSLTIFCFEWPSVWKIHYLEMLNCSPPQNCFFSVDLRKLKNKCFWASFKVWCKCSFVLKGINVKIPCADLFCSSRSIDVDGAVGVTLECLVEVTCCWSRVDKTGSRVGPACLVGWKVGYEVATCPLTWELALEVPPAARSRFLPLCVTQSSYSSSWFHPFRISLQTG